MKIVNYKTFKTSEEFVAWQLESERQIISIMPLVSGLEGSTASADSDNTTASFETYLSVFVTYFEESEASA